MSHHLQEQLRPAVCGLRPAAGTRGAQRSDSASRREAMSVVAAISAERVNDSETVLLRI